MSGFNVEFWWYDNDGEEHSGNAWFRTEDEAISFCVFVVAGKADNGYGEMVSACSFQGIEYEFKG